MYNLGKNCLKLLQVAMTTHDSVFLPSVTSGAEVFESLMGDADPLTNQMVVSELQKPYLIDDAPTSALSQSASRLLIVRLPDTASLQDIGEQTSRQQTARATI